VANDDPLPVLWLLPERSAQDFLDDAIGELARCHATVEFQSHVTLQVLSSMGLDEAAALGRDLATQTSALSVSVRGVETASSYFRFLSLGLDVTPELAALRERACSLCQQPATAFSPHLSLMYHPEDVALQTHIQQSMAHAPLGAIEHIVLDRLAVVNVAPPVSNWRVSSVSMLACDQ